MPSWKGPGRIFEKLELILERVPENYRPFVKKCIELRNIKLAGQETGFGGNYPHMIIARLKRQYLTKDEIRSLYIERQEKEKDPTQMTEPEVWKRVKEIATDRKAPAAALKALEKVMSAKGIAKEGSGSVYSGPQIIVCCKTKEEVLDQLRKGGRWNEEPK